ncbi:MAG TPA: cytochrome c biogenesis protein CcdA [Paludibacteraceae bacterium]|nr:cytochrome c biogenesis protein CcdA [Paludibacteraceae bacterium]
MSKKVYLAVLLLLFSTLSLFPQIYEPITWKISSVEKDNTIEIKFEATIEKGWHLYGTSIPVDGPRPTSFVFNTLNNATLVGGITPKSKLIREYDNVFNMELSWFANSASFSQTIKITDKPYHIAGFIEFMGCNGETCLSPSKVPFEFKSERKDRDVTSTTPIAQTSKNQIVETKSISTQDLLTDSDTIATVAIVPTPTNDWYTPVIEDLQAFNNDDTKTANTTLWMIFILGFLGGFVALFTPCVWPIIPMTVSFFLKRSDDKRKGRRDAILYGVSIVVIYLTLGILITLIFGASALNSLATNAFFNLFFFALLVLFAVSFFGAFELTLPASWSSKLDQKAEKTSGILSILLMSFTLVLVSFSCTGPIIGTLLVEVSTTGSLLAPAIGMLGFAVALALPFSLFALFPSWLKSMPKSGGWLNSVKVVLGFLELALALKFLSVADLAYGWGILDREVFLVLWIVIFALLGFYLLGKIILPHDDKLERISVLRLLMALVSFAFAIYMIPGLWGAPLKAISAFAPPLSTQDFNLYTKEVHAAFDDYELGMRYAKEKNKPVIVNFSGYGCVNCRKMEASVWTDPYVADLLQNDYVLITLFVDDKTPLSEPYEVEENGTKRTIETIGDRNSYLQRYKFGANAQPYYVVVDNKGKPLSGSYAFDENPNNLIEFLENALKQY